MMPGLINRHTRNALQLQNCQITGCINGYSSGVTATLTYQNDEDHLVDGLYIFPIDDLNAVIGFEAEVYGRTYTVQIRDKSVCEEAASQNDTGNATSSHNCLNQGKFIVNEFDETSIFTATIGTIPPFGTVRLLISIVSELEITIDSALIFQLPSVFTPRYCPASLPDQSSLLSVSYFGSDDHIQKNTLSSLLEIAREIPTTSFKYDFGFHLEVKAPALLAGVSSGTHSIRVDADPCANDASEVIVSLAEPHCYTTDLQIAIFLAKPHEPSVVIEHGDMTAQEYEEHLKSTDSFSSLINTEKTLDDSVKVSLLRSRIHKDIMHCPIVMLNYSPDFDGLADALHKKFEVPGEFIFVVDRSGSMSGANIANARETLMLFLKSLPNTCQFNIIGFGSGFKPLFESSRPYTQVTVNEGSQYVTKMKADMGGTNLYSPLEWIFKKPTCRGFPRHVFVLTDGTVSNIHQVIELVKYNSRNTRVFSFGIGPRASVRLVQGIAAAGRGTAEFIGLEERMQSKVITSLKKALQPFVSDVNVTWSLPHGLEMYETTKELQTLTPGEKLVIYGVMYDTNIFKVKKENEGDKPEKDEKEDKEETQKVKTNQLDEKVPSKEKSSLEDNLLTIEPKSDQQVKTLDNRALVALRQKLSRDEDADTKSSDEGIVDDQVQQRYFDIISRNGRALSNPETAFDSALLRKLLDSIAEEQKAKAARKEERRARYRERYTNTEPRRKISDVVLAPFTSEWDHYMQLGLGTSTSDSFRFSWDEDGTLPMKEGDNEGLAVVRGLFCGRPFHCQICFDLSTVMDGVKPVNEDEFWEDTVHRLAAKSMINHYDNLYYHTLKDDSKSGSRNELSSDDASSYKSKMIDISQASGVVSRHTVFVTVNQESNEELPTYVQIQQMSRRNQKQAVRRSSYRRSGYTTGLGRRPDSSFNDHDDDDGFLSRGSSFLDPMMSSSHSLYGGYPAEEYMEPNSPSPSPTYRVGTPESIGRSLSVSVSQAMMSGGGWSRSSSLKKKASYIGAKLMRARFGNAPSKQPLFKAFMPDRSLSTEVVELLSLIDLQLACGAWELNLKLAEALDIPLESLRRSSPLCHMRPPACTCGHEIQIRVEDMSEEVDSGEELDFDDRGSSSGGGVLRRQQRVSEDDNQGSSSNTVSPALSQSPAHDKDENQNDMQNEDGEISVVVPELNRSISSDGQVSSSSSPKEKKPPKKEDSCTLLLQTTRMRRKSMYSRDSKESSSLSMQSQDSGDKPKFRNKSPGNVKEIFTFPTRRRPLHHFPCRFSTTDEDLSVFSDSVFSPTSPPDYGTPVFRIEDEESNQLWATALSLSWLEHKCCNFFEEWELIAAKADGWLSDQHLPNGFDLPGLKAAASQVLVLLSRPKLQRQESILN